MDDFSFYYISVGYPIFMAMFAIGGAILLYKQRSILNVGICLGFAMLLCGFILENYGPRSISYNQYGDAIIQFTWVFNLGRHISFIGMFLAALCFLVKSVRHEKT